jgi:hypothetical protein
VDISNLTRNLIASLAGEEIAGGRIRDPAGRAACIPPASSTRLP